MLWFIIEILNRYNAFISRGVLGKTTLSDAYYTEL